MVALHVCVMVALQVCGVMVARIVYYCTQQQGVTVLPRCSEPEALLLRGIAEALQPHVWLNVHSGMEALFMPYDHQPRVPPGGEAHATLQLLEVVMHQKRCIHRVL